MFDHKHVHKCRWYQNTLGLRSMIDFIVLSSDLRHSNYRGNTHCSASLGKPMLVCCKGGSEEQCRFRPGRGAVDQLFTLVRLFEGAWEFAYPVYMCCVAVSKCKSFYDHSKSCVCILHSKSSTFSVGVGLCKGCLLSQILFVISMDRILRCSWGEKSVWFGAIRITSLLLADYVVLLVQCLH